MRPGEASHRREGWQTTDSSGMQSSGWLPNMVACSSPAIGSGVPPNCEAYGYLLDRNGNCKYITAYEEAVARSDGGPVSVTEKTCLCTQMRRFKVWTCGHYAYRLKETALAQGDGTWQLPSAEHVFRDYLYSTDHEVHRPEPDAGEPAP